ncbi:MAG TPA: succinyl-diaminopimelate desuccinylase [Polyangiaceae bacterium]|nr:succinyl-diaminopimelate desuccinylase [Polyangiaceae bacterium]
MSLTETLLWLCEIPSPIGEERALADALWARFASESFDEPARRYGDSLVFPVCRGRGGPHVVLAGHLDVVRTQHDGPPRIEGDKLYAPGAADMKSGLALMVDMLQRPPLGGAKRGLDLSVVFYAREEGPYAENELGLVLEQDQELRHASIAVMLEPSDNKLQLGCGGSLHARVTFHGRTAHSARPWQGENAIHKAAGLLARLSSLPVREQDCEGLRWRDVISATMAQGGRARNIIPDRFELNLNHRFGPLVDLEQAERNVLDLVAGDAEVEFVDRSPSALPYRAHPLVQALAESGVAAVEPKQAWTDVARFAAMGVPAVNFGPGVQAQAHQRNEWTHLPALETGREILSRWLRRITS